MREIFLIVVSLLLAGCTETIQAVQNVTSLYTSARAVSTGYNAFEMTKSIKDAEPLFEKYNNIVVSTLIMPRKNKSAQELSDAFTQNFHYIISEDLNITQGDLVVTKEVPKKGMTIALQFKERGYNENLLQSILQGDQMRGTLFYIDQNSGKVIKEESIESLSSYGDILRLIHASVAGKMIKSFSKDPEEVQSTMDQLKSFDPIMPQHKHLFTRG